jgi:hypothetical protein
LYGHAGTAPKISNIKRMINNVPIFGLSFYSPLRATMLQFILAHCVPALVSVLVVSLPARSARNSAICEKTAAECRTSSGQLIDIVEKIRVAWPVLITRGILN